MEEVWLSVIVPSHNGQRWLSAALQSLRNWLLSQPDAAMHLHPCYIVDEVGRETGAMA